MNVLHFATGAGACDAAFPFVAALFAAAPRTLLLGLSLAREHQGQLTPKDRAVLNGHERLALLFGAVERLDDAEVERILATARAPPPPPLPRARSRPAAAAPPPPQAPPVPRLRASSSDEELELAEFFGVPRPPPADAPAASPAEPPRRSSGRRRPPRWRTRLRFIRRSPSCPA